MTKVSKVFELLNPEMPELQNFFIDVDRQYISHLIEFLPKSYWNQRMHKKILRLNKNIP